jgi:HEAT repeat protein
MGLGFLAFRDYFNPHRVWNRQIHDPDALSRAWAGVEREHKIEGLDARETLAEIFRAMNDPDPAIRAFAIGCLPILEGEPVTVIAHLREKMADTDVDIRIKTAEALGQIFKREKPGRPEALASLELALKDSDPRVRRAAVGSIGQVVYESGRSSDPLRSGQKDDPALQMIAHALGDQDMAVRVEAAFVLGCNDRGEESVPMLVKFLKEQPAPAPLSYLANRAFMALTILAVRSKEAVAILTGEVSVERESYPDRPRDALAWAARQSPEAHLAVRKQAREGLHSEEPATRFQFAFLMHDIGMGVEVLDVLVEAIQDADLEVRIRAIEAIADIGEADPRAMAALQAASNDQDIEIRGRAMGALEEIELKKMQ